MEPDPSRPPAIVKLSVSNLGWGGLDRKVVRSFLSDMGVSGVELAPTIIWRDGQRVDHASAASEADFWASSGLSVSGIQSLLYGRPELQLFDANSHESLLEQLGDMARLANALGSRKAVFGSPKNRVRGRLAVHLADEMATAFFSRLVPVLEDEDVTLTLEPNAPEYGADYLTDYESCVRLSHLIGSSHIQPQIDTGCLWMAGVDSAAAVRSHAPTHVHVSAPRLAPPPGDIDHAAIRAALEAVAYDGWCTLEMLPTGSRGDYSIFAATVAWLNATYGASA